MKKIKFTYVDSITEISVAKEPAKNGPHFPKIKGLQFVFAAERKYPTDVPEFFGTCDDDADLGIDGCFGEITEAEFATERQTEINSRKPFASWVVNQEVWDNPLMRLVDLWSPPVSYPDDGMYSWDEETTSWVAIEPAGNAEA
jgi:hypothetical protein